MRSWLSALLNPGGPNCVNLKAKSAEGTDDPGLGRSSIYIFAYYEYGENSGIFRTIGKSKEFAAFFPYLGDHICTIALIACGIYVATCYEYGIGYGIFKAVCKVCGTFVFPKSGDFAFVACGIYLIVRYEYGTGVGITPKSKTLPAMILSKTTTSNPANCAMNTESSLC